MTYKEIGEVYHKRRIWTAVRPTNYIDLNNVNRGYSNMYLFMSRID